MGFFKKMGDAINNAADNMAADMRAKEERRRQKVAILDRFELADLKKLCGAYGVGEPAKYDTDILMGTKTKRNVTRQHWLDLAFNEVKLEQLVAFCDKNRIRISDIVTPAQATSAAPIPAPFPAPASPRAPTTPPTNAVRPTAPPGSPPPGLALPLPPKPQAPTLAGILADIAAHFECSNTRDEKEFQNMMAVYLRTKYGNNVEREVPSQQGKIDFVLFRRFGLELKIGEKPQVLRNLIGQVHAYKKVYSELGIVILDVGLIDRHDMQEFLNDYAKFGAKAILVEGELRRRKTSGLRIQVDRA